MRVPTCLILLDKKSIRQIRIKAAINKLMQQVEEPAIYFGRKFAVTKTSAMSSLNKRAEK
jgi:hypothetical protein